MSTHFGFTQRRPLQIISFVLVPDEQWDPRIRPMLVELDLRHRRLKPPLVPGQTVPGPFLCYTVRLPVHPSSIRGVSRAPSSLARNLVRASFFASNMLAARFPSSISSPL